MRFGSLFAGIGGMDLGLEWAGMECAWQVEIDDYCQRVLAKHWPNVARYADVRECGKQNLQTVDLIAGGFPCQPHSVAGKRRGAEDDRNLWPEFGRIVAELRPRYVLAENVPGIISTYLDTVLSDLDNLGYTCATFNLPAVAFDAPHRRERIFVLAHANEQQTDIQCGGPNKSSRQSWQSVETREKAIRQKNKQADNYYASRFHTTRFSMADAENGRFKGKQHGGNHTRGLGSSSQWAVEPSVGRVAYGIPRRVDRLRGLGNAVVPQVAEWIGRRILEHAQTQQPKANIDTSPEGHNE